MAVCVEREPRSLPKPSGRWLKSIADVRKIYVESSPFPLIKEAIKRRRCGYTRSRWWEGSARATLLKSTTVFPLLRFGEWKRIMEIGKSQKKCVLGMYVNCWPKGSARNVLLICTGADTGKVYALLGECVTGARDVCRRLIGSEGLISHLQKTLKNRPLASAVMSVVTSARLTRVPPTGWPGIGHGRDLPRRPKATVTDSRHRRDGEPACVLPPFVSQQLWLWIKLVYSPPPAEFQLSESWLGLSSCWAALKTPSLYPGPNRVNILLEFTIKLQMKLLLFTRFNRSETDVYLFHTKLGLDAKYQFYRDVYDYKKENIISFLSKWEPNNNFGEFVAF